MGAVGAARGVAWRSPSWPGSSTCRSATTSPRPPRPPGTSCAGTARPRWLLIFDNADDPAARAATSRRVRPCPDHLAEPGLEPRRRAARGGRLHPGREHRAPAAARPGAHSADAQPGRRGPRRPAAGRRAGRAWLNSTGMPAGAYVAQLGRSPPGPWRWPSRPDYPTPVVATWNLSIDRLAAVPGRGPAAGALRLLLARPDLHGPALQRPDDRVCCGSTRTPSEKFMLGKVIQEIGRYALAKIDPGSNTFQMHRLVQAVIRSKLTEEQQDEAPARGARDPGGRQAGRATPTTRRTGPPSTASGRTWRRPRPRTATRPTPGSCCSTASATCGSAASSTPPEHGQRAHGSVATARPGPPADPAAAVPHRQRAAQPGPFRRGATWTRPWRGSASCSAPTTRTP